MDGDAVGWGTSEPIALHSSPSKEDDYSRKGLGINGNRLDALWFTTQNYTESTLFCTHYISIVYLWSRGKVYWGRRIGKSKSCVNILAQYLFTVCIKL